MQTFLQKIGLSFFSVFLLNAESRSQNVGVFDGHNDVGKVLHAGSLTYNGSGEYQLSGAGTNIWFDHDEFQFAWKKLKGDFILQCRASFVGKGIELHRKM